MSTHPVTGQSRRGRSAAFTPLHLRYARGTPEHPIHEMPTVKRRERRAITAMTEAIPHLRLL